MALHETHREDLFAEATALVRRIELRVPGEPHPVVAGCRASGAWSVYFGPDPCYHFDEQGRLRRAFVDDRLYRTQGNTLAQLSRKRHADNVELSRIDLSAADFASVDEPPAPQPMMFNKYIPRTGEWGTADVDYFTVTAPDGPTPQLRSASVGVGRFSFHRARWEDMPTQYPIVNALADLPLEEFGPAWLIETSGGGDVSGQRRLR